MDKEKFYKKKWFTVLLLIFIAPIGILLMWINKHWSKKARTILSIVFGVYFIIVAIASQSTEEEKAAETVKQEQVEKEKEDDEKVDLDIELEITETKISEDEVTIKGTTNLIDGAFLGYQIKATEGDVRVKDGTWEITKTIKELKEDDEHNVYGDGDEYNFYITFPAFGVDEEQSEEILEIYGGTGATKITGGPDFYESEDGTLKTVSISIDFDKDGIIDPEERKEREFEQAIEDWSEYRLTLLDHYGEFGITDIQAVDGYDVFYAYVPNEFKLTNENEKQYYVEEIGPHIVNDLNAHFGGDAWLEFNYEDGNTMASRKMFGGWKIK